MLFFEDYHMNRIAHELVSIARLLIAQEPMTDEEKIRRRKKVDAIRNLSENLDRLKRRLNKDLNSDDDKERLTALVISVMDKTAERVGNQDSADDGHFGVTGFRKKHITVEGKKVSLKYVGKSGVKHEKGFSDQRLANMIKECMDGKSDNDPIFVTPDGFEIKADRVNRYLSDFDIKAKDIRGYAANRYMVNALKKSNDHSEEKDRKKHFLELLRNVAEKVGHTPAILRSSYLLPNLESEYVKKGKIIKI